MAVGRSCHLGRSSRPAASSFPATMAAPAALPTAVPAADGMAVLAPPVPT